MKYINVIAFLFLSLSLLANTDNERRLDYSIKSKLDSVKMILNSPEWKAIDLVDYERMSELVEYIENEPIDSLLRKLYGTMRTDSVFFTRDISWITEAEDVDGYISAKEINNALVDIEKRVADELHIESIVVPEEEFAGMLAKVPVITYGNIEQLIEDSIVIYPDSILLIVADAKLTRSANKMKDADSIRISFLNEKRQEYNNSLIKHYRDSVTNAYRQEYFDNYVTKLKKAYADSIAKHNIAILTAYNNSVSNVLNKQYCNNFKALIDYADTLPFNIALYNYLDEKSAISLQNKTGRFKWVWLKNSRNDSIAIRFEVINKHAIKALVDETVNLSRINAKKTVDLENLLLDNNVETKLEEVKDKTPVLSPWDLDGKVYCGFTQTFINDYWSAGGNSSAAVLSTFAYDANYSKGKVKWENGVDAKLGLTYYMPEDGTTVYRNWHKNSDVFELTSKFGYSAFKEWYYSASAEFETQFFDGFSSTSDSTVNSSIVAPAYLTFSAGFDYKPDKSLSIFLAPLSLKITYVYSDVVDETDFGLDEGATSKRRIGTSGTLEYNKKISDDITLKSENSLFLNYGFDDGVWQFLKVPDFDSETTIDFKVNQFISTELNFHFKYDKDVESSWTDDDGNTLTGTKLQVKQYFTLGISYKFL